MCSSDLLHMQEVQESSTRTRLNSLKAKKRNLFSVQPQCGSSSHICEQEFNSGTLIQYGFSVQQCKYKTNPLLYYELTLINVKLQFDAEAGDFKTHCQSRNNSIFMSEVGIT